MSNPIPPTRLSFEENISTLLEELLLAAQWHRPSILLVVHKSKFGQAKAETTLEARLSERGHPVAHITVDKDRSDIPHLITSTPAAEQTTFFVSNLDWGGGEDRRDAYRALNIYRELFVDHHLKVVFWLTVNEAATLARYAPDFWAFRHRVIEFIGQRLPRKVDLPAGALLWDIQNSVDPADTLEARVAVREELLARLPNSMEARSARVDLLYNLGYLYWMRGNTGKAADDFNAALHLIGQALAGPIRSGILNGLAIIAYEANDRDRAMSLLQQALQDDPENACLMMNQSATAAALGRNLEAIALAKKALKNSPRDPRMWGAQGYIFAAMGKFDESITSFTKAAELAPRSAIYAAALAICYDLVERPDQAVRQLDLARDRARDQMPVYLDIYEAALFGDSSKSLQLAQSAVRLNQLSPLELRRDPSLRLLFDTAQIDKITA